MLILAFFLGLAALILQGILLPRLPILALAPFLCLAMIRCKKEKALWLSALGGAIVDLLSDDPIGLHALNYTLVSALLFRFKNYFSDDQPFHLSLFTMITSSLSTLLQLILLFLFDRRVPISGKWALIDIFAMPIAYH